MISLRFDQLSSLDPMWSSEGQGTPQETRVTCRKVCGGGVLVVTDLRQSQKGGTVTPSGHTRDTETAAGTRLCAF